MIDELYEEHFKYEVDMMTFCMNILFHQTEAGVLNMIHETFHVHLRNVVNYIETHSVLKVDDFIHHNMKLAEDQIFTLTGKRTAVMLEKIQFTDNQETYERLLPTLTQFRAIKDLALETQKLGLE
jgi:hypothetical protein